MTENMNDIPGSSLGIKGVENVKVSKAQKIR